jgi:hypothetical protein
MMCVGGSIETVFENGFLFDRGPNSALETTPVIGYLDWRTESQRGTYLRKQKGE